VIRSTLTFILYPRALSLPSAFTLSLQRERKLSSFSRLRGEGWDEG